MSLRGWAGALALLLFAGSARSEPSGSTRVPPAVPIWSGDHALTLPPRRVELALFGSSRYGLSGLELSLHPITFFALPQLELKGSPFAWQPSHVSALRVRVSYPTLFLGLVSREGAGGLLPKTSAPPQAVQVEGDFLVTALLGDVLRHGYRHLATATLGLAIAPRASYAPSALPLLDFPFLYQRFAALYTWGVPRFSLGVTGPLWQDRLFYEAKARYYLMPDLPDVGTAFALEPSLALEYRFNRSIAASLELKGSLARYAYGTRLHVLPFADLRVGF
jgi:hypothetical protein